MRGLLAPGGSLYLSLLLMICTLLQSSKSSRQTEHFLKKPPNIFREWLFVFSNVNNLMILSRRDHIHDVYQGLNPKWFCINDVVVRVQYFPWIHFFLHLPLQTLWSITQNLWSFNYYLQYHRTTVWKHKNTRNIQTSREWLERALLDTSYAPTTIVSWLRWLTSLQHTSAAQSPSWLQLSQISTSEKKVRDTSQSVKTGKMMYSMNRTANASHQMETSALFFGVCKDVLQFNLHWCQHANSATVQIDRQRRENDDQTSDIMKRIDHMQKYF